ncbi:hypothetical protein PF010_g20416 [Phytophthora fragariae]|uniref:Uncharacterized protein n=1 Tax=Phytophthora fragariae TaxID=53985 RepID=A0A6G0KET9_9STRA|nr:hypothetical protein PF010_g20416 [Phytophthora fragariae]
MSDDEDKLLRLLVDKYIKKGKPKGSKVHDTGRMLALLAFWCDMREALAANEATMGLEILDDVAEAILDESGKAKEALSGPVLILPEPSRQCKSQGAPDHQRFTSYMPESPKSQPSSAKNPPFPGKKRKASSAAKAVSFFMDALAEKVPQQIRIDLDKLYEPMDVDARPEKRLSDRALARILHDINSKRDARAHWVGDRAKGTWLALWNCDRIQKEEANISKELLDDKYKFPEVPPFDPKEAKAPGYTPILTPQGSYTALWKSNSGDDDEDDEEDDGSGSEEDDSEEEKPPPPKKAKPSRSSSDSSGDGNTATL